MKKKKGLLSRAVEQMKTETEMRYLNGGIFPESADYKVRMDSDCIVVRFVRIPFESVKSYRIEQKHYATNSYNYLIIEFFQGENLTFARFGGKNVIRFYRILQNYLPELCDERSAV